MKEYNVSLRKPNKRLAIKNEDRIIRIKYYLQNIWTVRKYFLDTEGVDPPIISGDQMPLHRNENAGQRTLSLKSEETFVKENYMLSRERVTRFTQLCSDPNKIPSPSRDEVMRMLLKAWDLLDIDTEREFKYLFVTNALNGSEDYLVSDKLYALVVSEMVKFRTELMTSLPAKTLKEVIRKLILPKGVKRKGNDEGIELLDCEEEEIPLEELEQECDDELCDDDEVENVTSWQKKIVTKLV